MIRVESVIDVAGVTARQLTDFLLDCDDAAYRAWWPGTHLRFHTVRPGPDHVGDLVLMDEYVGRRRVRMTASVVEAVPGERIVWRLRKGVPLPAWLTLQLAPRDGGVRIRHTITAGWTGPGRVLDPLIRRYLSPRFAADMDQHAHAEFPRLAELLASRQSARASSGHPA